MNHLNLSQLTNRLDSTSRELIEKAVQLAHQMNHDSVSDKHCLYVLIKCNPCIRDILENCEINCLSFEKTIYQQLEDITATSVETPTLSPTIIEWLKETWLHASLLSGIKMIQPIHFIEALISNSHLFQIIALPFKEFSDLKADQLALATASVKDTAEKTNAIPKNAQENTKNLDQYTINLNQLASQKKIQAAVGRDHETHQLFQILLRKKQNNPILIGEPGVGKTAIVEGLALCLANKNAPNLLKNHEIRSLDMGLLMAGASIKGEFEKRLKGIIDEIKNYSKPIILFIDEAHTIVGAGNLTGGLDTANLLKPALARGELRTIAATTTKEYALYFEKDAALSRRFQPVFVKEPSDDQSLMILKSMRETLQRHHQVTIKNDALTAAVSLSRQYIADRHLPDKAVSVLDTACAQTALQQQATPFLLQKATNELQQLQEQHNQIKQQKIFEKNNDELKKIKSNINKTGLLIKSLKKEIRIEKQIIKELKYLSALKRPTTEHEKKFKKLLSRLDIMHKKHHHIPFCVDKKAIENIITEWTGVPLDRLSNDMHSRLQYLEKTIKERVIDQDQAIDTVMNTIKNNMLNLNNPNKPLGVFLFTGPSGVGKTHMAQSIAELFFGSKEHFTVLNMSEFKESHKVSMLLGSPPGYIGYGEGGVLTEAVRRQPYHLVLIDEIEKAHPQLHEVFYQIFDQGEAKDSQGRHISFRQTIFILTSNIGSEQLLQPDNAINQKLLLKQELLNHFKPAFIGRLKTVPFYGISDQSARQIIVSKLNVIKSRVDKHHSKEFIFNKKTVDLIIENSDFTLTGAREFDAIIDRIILPEVSRRLLNNKKCNQIQV
jgi:type VI secretion system protein VasG